MTNFIEELNQAFSQHQNAENAIAMARYMKGISDFYGVNAEKRRLLFKATYQAHGLEVNDENIEQIILSLFKHQKREMAYCAVDLINRRKLWKQEQSINLFEELICINSWWDTVDSLHNAIGKYYLTFPNNGRKIVETWNASDNLWLVRMSIIFQLNFKNLTNKELLLQMILAHASEKEFFIKKAIGWALRQYARVNPNWVLQVLDNHQFQALSIKEATKHL